MATNETNPPDKEVNCEVGPWLPGLTADNYPELPTDHSLIEQAVSLEINRNTHLSAYSDTYKSSLDKYFTETTMSWMNGDAIIYNPGNTPLKTKDVWKWDISGESDYGLIEPPINEPNYDLFDSNWAAQFVVFGPGNLSCKSLDLDWCSYPVKDQPKRATQGDIHANCPAQSSKPTEVEPSYLKLYEAYLKTNECDLIKSKFGEKYMGCIWNDPKHPCSCSCPEQGVSFGDYLSYTRTYSTFLQTPHNTPLVRIAQMGQLKSNTITVTVAALSKELKLGDIIIVQDQNKMIGREERKIHGKWLITEIEYKFENKNQSTILTLMRDTNKYKAHRMGWDSPIYILEQDKWES